MILVLGAAGFTGWKEYAAVRDDLADQRQAIDDEWSQVDAALERRADVAAKVFPELPGLAAASAALTAARTPQEKIGANNRLSALLAPAPKTESGGSSLRLSDAENRIAIERRRYNEMLEHYNAQIQRFPDNVVAALAGFHRDDAYLPTEAGATH
jgi:LemA protein